MTMRHDLCDRLTRFLDEVWNAGNVAAAEGFIAPRYTIHHDPGDPWDGKTLTLDEFKDRVEKSRKPFPDQVFTIVRMLRDGDSVAISWHWAGTHMGDLAGFAASGRRLTMTGMTIYDFDSEGRLTGHWQQADRPAIYQQLTAAD